MKTKINRTAIAAVLSLALLFTGCLSVNREFKRVRNQFISGMNTNFEREIEFSIGPAGMLFASMFVRIANTEENIDQLITQVNQIQLGVYKPESYQDPAANFEVLKNLDREMNSYGWNNIVKTADRGEMAGVFVRDFDEDKGLKEIFVVALNEDGLIMVQIHGELDKLIEIAIRENGLKLETVKN
jgi:hypothetical protein